MFIRNFIVLSVLTVTSTISQDSDYCDASLKSCGHKADYSKHIFYDVNPPEGFNLRRDVYMRFAIMLAEANRKGLKLDWKLVLPPWYELYHWQKYTDPLPWGEFFDVSSLQAYSPVVEMNTLFPKFKYGLKIDTLYVLQNFDNPFEDGEFKEKWEIVEGVCDYHGFWGYSNITVNEKVCVRFQGHISKLWEVIAIHPNDKMVMFAHGEIPLHDNYGDKQFWDCRKSMKFSPKLVEVAKKYITHNLNCDTIKCTSYIAVHWRRRDFAVSRSRDVPTITGTVKQLKIAAEKYVPQTKTIYIATDAPNAEITDLKSRLENLGFYVFRYKPSNKEKEIYHDGGIAIIDQIICSHAAYFIGTHESTFTFRIQEEREILGFKSKTTFNRLCPDSGPCEKASKWTIVN